MSDDRMHIVALRAIYENGINMHLKSGLAQAIQMLEERDVRIVYLEAQEKLLEEWQQRALKAEAALAEVERPLDAQMARLNERVISLNKRLGELNRWLTPVAGKVCREDPESLCDGKGKCCPE